MYPRSRWRPRRRRSASLAAALAVAALVLSAPLAGPATAAPSNQPGGTSGVLDSAALDQLQQRAAEVQKDLRSQQAEAPPARKALAEAKAGVAAARQAVADAEGQLSKQRAVVASYASAVYRDGGSLTPLTLLLSGGDPGDVLTGMGYLDVVDRHAADVIGAAEKLRQAALDQQRRAKAALAKAQQRADEVSARVAQLEAAA